MKGLIMFGKRLIHIGGNSSRYGALVERPITALIRPSSIAMVAIAVMLVSLVRRELCSFRRFAVSLVMRHLRVLQAAAMIVLVGLVGCNQPDRFEGFASEQLSDKMDEVLAVVEAQTGTIQALSKQVSELNQILEQTQSASESQITRLQTLESKLKAKLTSTPPKAEVEGVGTLDVENAPSATLTLDSLDDAANQIMALQKRIDELEKRCNSFASAKPTYAGVSGGSNGGSSGGVSKSSGSTGPLFSPSLNAWVDAYGNIVLPPTSNQPAQPVQSNSANRSQAGTAVYCVDQYGNRVPCNASQSSSQQNVEVRKGLFGRTVVVR